MFAPWIADRRSELVGGSWQLTRIAAASGTTSIASRFIIKGTTPLEIPGTDLFMLVADPEGVNRLSVRYDEGRDGRGHKREGGRLHG